MSNRKKPNYRKQGAGAGRGTYWKIYQEGRKAKAGGVGMVVSPSSNIPPKFNSEGDRLIYALVKLDGGARMDELGMTRALYSDREAAKKWHRNIAKLIHPDKNTNPLAETAFKVLETLYANVKG